MSAVLTGSFVAGFATVFVFEFMGRLVSTWQRKRVGVFRLPH